MLLEVRLLRREGVRLDRTAVFDEPSYCGHLCLRTSFADPVRPPWAPGTCTHAFLTSDPDREWRCLLHLKYAHISRWRGREFVIVGRDGPKGEHYSGRPHPQAWWCRLTAPGSVAVEPRPAPPTPRVGPQPALPRTGLAIGPDEFMSLVAGEGAGDGEGQQARVESTA